MLRALGHVAAGAKKLNVSPVVPAAQREWHNVIDVIFAVKFDFAGRVRAPTFLEFRYVANVVGRKLSPCGSLPSPAGDFVDGTLQQISTKRRTQARPDRSSCPDGLDLGVSL